MDETGIGPFPAARLALVLDAQGRPHLAYVAWKVRFPEDRYLKYAFRGP